MTSNSRLVDLIYDASAHAFNEWRNANPAERVFAFALSNIDDAIYVSAALNSEESHLRRLKKRCLDPSSNEGLSEKWGPWQWEENEFISPESFAAVDHQLKILSDRACEDGLFPEFRSQVFESMLQALSNLRKDSIVTNDGDSRGIVMFMTLIDSFDAEMYHRRSAELLNPPEYVPELLAAIGG